MQLKAIGKCFLSPAQGNVLAMLDKNNTGFLLNAIHSRENCFLYIKEIVNGESYVMLSEEEVEALKRAVNYGLEESEFDLSDI